MATEEYWRANDCAHNGKQEYWTRDISAFYWMPDAGGSPSRLIDRNFADADGAPEFHPVPNGPVPKDGYLYQAIPQDASGAPASNRGGFAFVAYPSTWHATVNRHRHGWLKVSYPTDRQFIVNQDGRIWCRDTGSQAPTMTWPAKDPQQAGWEDTDAIR